MKKFIALLGFCAILAAGCTKDNGNDENGGKPEEEISAPAIPADPKPESTSFAHRIILLQHTGTACPNCPRLMTALKELAGDASYAAKYHHVAAHSYNTDDPAYSKAAKGLSDPFCSAYPELSFNLTTENIGTNITVPNIKEHIDGLHNAAAEAGIAAAARLIDNTVTVNIQIKAAKENSYRVTAWLLEDNIEADQYGATADWQHTHSNAIRAYTGTSANIGIYGEKLGTVEAGKTAEKALTINLKKGWKVENCKVLVIVNGQKDGKYDVINCAICPIGGDISYKYN